MGNINVEDWSNIIQAIVGMFIAGTFVVYYRMWKTMQETSEGENVLSLVNFLQQKYVRQAREIVILNLRNKDYAEWSEEERAAASNVCSSYTVAGLLIKDNRVPLSIFAENWGSSIYKCYRILETFINELRKPEEAGPNYMAGFNWLYDETVPYVPNEVKVSFINNDEG